MEFIFLFTYRVLSGLQNGLGYRRHNLLRSITSYLLALAALAIIFIAIRQAPLIAFLSIAGALISALGAIGVEDSFNKKTSLLREDIHFWEMLATGGVMISVTILGGNLILILASVYPALIIHKGLINTFSGLSWWDQRTDDPTGKTFSIPLLGIAVPRMGLRGRQALAVASLMATAIAWAVPVRMSVYDILIMIF